MVAGTDYPAYSWAGPDYLGVSSRLYTRQPGVYRALREVELLPGFESFTGTDEFTLETAPTTTNGQYVLNTDYAGGQGSYESYGYYRYGFNGKENDNEVKGAGNQQDYGMRIYDPRVGRFLSVDPITKKYPELTPYQFASNTPIGAVDMDGLEGMAGPPMNSIYAANKPLYDDLIAGRNTPRVQNAQKAGGVIVLAGALALDAFVTRGWASRTLLASQVFGSLEHNRAKTEEGRSEQDKRAKEQLTDAAFTWMGGRLLGKLVKSAANLYTSVAYGEVSVATQVGKEIVEVGKGGVGPGGYIEMEINVKVGINGERVVSGARVFEEIFSAAKAEVGSNAIKGIRGMWSYGDNLKTFNELIVSKVNKGLMSMEEAAMQTFTGKMAKSQGFTNVTSIAGKQNADNTYQFVNVLFSK